MSLLSLILVLITLLRETITFDQGVNNIFVISGNFTSSDNYVAIMTADSQRNGNFFHFKGINGNTPLFVKANKFSSTLYNMGFVHTLVSSRSEYLLMSSDNATNQTNFYCIKSEYYTRSFILDCTDDYDNPSCNCLRATNNVYQTIFLPVNCTVSTSSVCLCLKGIYSDSIIIDGNSSYSSSNLICNSPLYESPNCTNNCYNISTTIVKYYNFYNRLNRIQMGFLNFTAIEVCEVAQVNFHFLKLYEGTQSNFAINSYLSKMLDYPSFYKSYVYNASFDSIPDDQIDYQTIIKTQLLDHNQKNNLFCQYNITFTGHLRYFEVNDMRSYSYSQSGYSGLDSFTTVLSDDWMILRPNSMNIIVFVGYRINKTDLSFINCRLGSLTGDLVTPEFSFYFYNETVIPSTNNFGINRCSCKGGCNRCLQSLYCFKCGQTSFLNSGNCYNNCPSNAPYKSIYSCTEKPVSLNTFLLTPQFDSSRITINGYVDFISYTTFIATFYYTNHSIITTQNLTYIDPNFPRSLSQSKSVYFSTATGFYNFSLDLEIISSNLHPGSEISNLVIYPVNPSDYYNMATYGWSSGYPNKINSTNLPLSNSANLAKIGKFYYLTRSSTYISEFILNCQDSCNLSVTTDGYCTAYLNDAIVLFSANFLNRWTYLVPYSFTGVNNVKIIFTNVQYHSVSISGTYSAYNPYSFISSSYINLPLNPSGECNIPDCLSCYGSICNSCENGYFLSADGQSCETDCNPDKFSRIERKCLSSCSGNRLILNTTDCAPFCREPGSYFDYTNGLTQCVDECLYCSDISSCDTCRYPSASNSATFCYRKSGDLFTPNPDFTVPQQGTLIGDYTETYMAILTDKSIFKYNTFYFYNSSRVISRILTAVKINPLSQDIGQINLPEIPISESGEISLHYIQLEPIVSSRKFSIAAYEDITEMEWPLVINSPIVTPLNIELLYQDPDYLPKGDWAYSTIILSRVYEHNLDEDIYCSWAFEFYGYIMGAYINGEQIYFDSTRSSTVITRTSNYHLIKKQEMILFTVFAQGLYYSSMDIVACRFQNSTEMNMTDNIFSIYAFKDSDSTSNHFTVLNNTFCPQECSRCSKYNYCIKCQSGYYLYNGLCAEYCPTEAPYYSTGGYCTPSQQIISRRGFVGNSNFVSTTFLYNWVLPGNQNSVFIWYTCGGTLQNTNYKIMTQQSASYTLGESRSVLINYNRASIYASYSQTLLYSLLSPTLSLHTSLTTQIYSIKNNSALLYYYEYNVESIGTWENATGFVYIDQSNKTLSLNNQILYVIKFYIVCGSCSFILDFEGYLKVIRNDRTTLFEGFKDGYLDPINLVNVFSGTNLITFIIKNANNFTYNIVNNHYIMTFLELVAFDYFTTTINSIYCNIPGCENCYSTSCFSCKSGSGFYKLASNLACSLSCGAGSSSLSGQKICTTSPCSNFGMAKIRNSCIFKCKKGLFWNDLTGCSSSCHPSCESCGGPNSNDCLSCHWPFMLNDTQNTCICPIGTIFNITTGKCQSTSYIDLKINPNIQSCSVLVFVAEYDPAEKQAYNYTFNWTLEYSTASQEFVINITNYLSLQNKSTIFIPSGMLETGKEYNISVAYYNVINDLIKESVYTITSLDSYPNVVIDGGLIQSLNPGEDNRIQLIVKYSDCLNLSTPIDVSWAYEAGFYLNPNNFFSISAPLYLNFPACSLAPDRKTNLTVKVWMKPTPLYFTELNFSLNIAPETFSAKILYGNKFQTSGYDINLEGKIIYASSCTPETGIITYIWKCLKSNFLPCSDSNNLFNTSSPNATLNYPNSYFNQGDSLTFTLKILKNGNSAIDSVTIQIASSSFLMMSIECDDGCAKYSVNARDHVFTVNLLLSGNPTLLNYNWTISPNLSYYQYANQIKIWKSKRDIFSISNYLTLEVTSRNSTNSGYAFKSILVNQPPMEGIVEAFPSVGISLATYFFIRTTGWIDTDLPLRSQFFYSTNLVTDYNALLTDYQITTSTSTLLPGDNPALTVNILISVMDSYSATNTATTSVKVTSATTSLQSTLSKSQEILNSLSNSDPFQVAKTVSLLTTELSSWENKSNSNSSQNICPLCSNHGSCTKEEKCVCQAGWAYYDCSLTESDYLDIIKLKTDLLISLKNSYNSLSTESMKTIVYNTLEQLSGNKNFNSNQSLLLIQDILENSLNITNPKTILTESQATSVSKILSSILEYSGYYDCSSITEFTKNMINKTYSYLEVISKGLLSSKLTNETESVLNTEAYSLLAKKLSVCDLDSLKLNLGSTVPSSVINYNANNLNCSEILQISLYAFDSNLMSCNASSASKYNTITVKISDNNANPVKLNLSISIKYPPEDMKEYCIDPCEIIGEFCDCDDLSVLDVKSQLVKLFFKSSLTKIANISALLGFKFWEVEVFWALLVFTLWLFFGLYIIKNFIPEYDIITNLKKKLKRNYLDLFLAAFVSVHPMLSVFGISHYSELSKSVRAYMYFIRNILIMTFSAMFGSAGGNDDLLSRILTFNIYLFILPYFTIFPLENLIEWLLEKPSDRVLEERKVHESAIKRIKKKFRIGIFLTVLVILGCFLIDLIIAAGSDEGQRTEWSGDLIKSIIQDLLITPFIYIIYQVFLIKFMLSNMLKSKPKLRKMASLRVTEPMFQIIQMLNYNGSKNKIFPLGKENKLFNNSNINRELSMAKSSISVFPTTSMQGFTSNLNNDKMPDSEGSVQETPVIKARKMTKDSSIQFLELPDAADTQHFHKDDTGELKPKKSEVQFGFLPLGKSPKSIFSEPNSIFDIESPKNKSNDKLKLDLESPTLDPKSKRASSAMENTEELLLMKSIDDYKNQRKNSVHQNASSPRMNHLAYKSTISSQIKKKMLGDFPKPSSFRQISLVKGNEMANPARSFREVAIKVEQKAGSTDSKISLDKDNDDKLVSIQNLKASPTMTPLTNLIIHAIDPDVFDMTPISNVGTPKSTRKKSVSVKGINFDHDEHGFLGNDEKQEHEKELNRPS